MLTINTPKIDGRAEAIVRYRQDGIRYAISPSNATATAKKTCNEVPAKPVDTERRRVYFYIIISSTTATGWVGRSMTSKIAGIRKREIFTK